MTTTAESQSLLREFITSRSPDAFCRIVQIYTPLVFSAALRATHGDIHLAQDIAQITFTSLAQKAATFSPTIVLSAWLYRHACHTARHQLRSDARRRVRESAAAVMHASKDYTADPWPAIAPILDDALSKLSERDRTALILRYFDKQDLRAVGNTLGLTDDAAQKRVTRALERLRRLLARRGVTVSTTAVATAIRGEATGAAVSAGLPKALTTAALTAPQAPAAILTSLTTIPSLRFIFTAIAIFLAIVIWLIRGQSTINTPTASVQPLSSRTPVLPNSTPTTEPPAIFTAAPGKANTPVVSPSRPTTDTPVSPFPAPPVGKHPAVPPPRNDAAYADAYRQHHRTKLAQVRLDALKAGTKAILAPHITHQQEIMTRWQAAKSGVESINQEESARLLAEAKLLEEQILAYRHGWEFWLDVERVRIRTSVFAELTGRERPLVLPEALTPGETISLQSAVSRFQNQQFEAAEAALLPLLESASAAHREQVAWQLMLSQLAQGKRGDATDTGNTLLRGSTASACFACAADSIWHGAWDQAQIWIDNAWEKAPHVDVTALAQSLITMGWATQDSQGKPSLIPPVPK